MLRVPGETIEIVGIGAEVAEPLGYGVESVQPLAGADPQDPGSVLE
jgi:hypothetical protein